MSSNALLVNVDTKTSSKTAKEGCSRYNCQAAKAQRPEVCSDIASYCRFRPYSAL